MLSICYCCRCIFHDNSVYQVVRWRVSNLRKNSIRNRSFSSLHELAFTKKDYRNKTAATDFMDLHSKQILYNFVKRFLQKPIHILKPKQFIEEFTHEYNQHLAKTGFMLKRDVNQIVQFIKTVICLIIAPLVTFLIIPIKEEISREHSHIFENNETISFKKFLMDYVSREKVKSIVCYPLEQKAVALLKQEAMSDDEDTLLLSNSLNIDLDEDLCSNPAKITEFIRKLEEHFKAKVPMEIEIITYMPRIFGVLVHLGLVLPILWIARGKLFMIKSKF